MNEYEKLEKLSDEVLSSMTEDEKFKIIEKHAMHRDVTGSGLAGCICPGCMGVMLRPVSISNNPDDYVVRDGEMFNKVEEDMFHQNLVYSKLMLDEKFKNGVIPTDNRDIRVVNELLTRVDTALVSRAKARASIKKDDEDSKIVGDMAAMLTTLNEARLNVPQQHIPDKLPNKILEHKFVPGSLTKGPDDITPENYFDNKDEE